MILNDDYASTGAGGLDQFLFQPTALGAAAGNAATVQDLNRALGERLDLSAIDAIAGTAGNDAFAFIGTAAFSGAPASCAGRTSAPSG